ncbi:MAG: DUF6194 family protein [Pseudomonadota bacterium]
MTRLLVGRFDGLARQKAYGEDTFFHKPSANLKRGSYFCTIKSQDCPHHKASKLSRTDVWRFNFGLPPKRYLELFGPKPPRPVKGWMGPVRIINPERETIDLIWPDIERTYENERAVFAKRVAKEA